MAKALIVYASRTDGTRKIADLVSEGIRSEGAKTEVVNANKIKKEADLDGYDAYVFGSATYHGEMMQGMKTMLFLADKASLEGKVGGAFGAYGWSGEAPVRIFDTMKNIFKMDMVNESLRLNTASLGGGTHAAQDYGRDVGRKLNPS